MKARYAFLISLLVPVLALAGCGGQSSPPAGTGDEIPVTSPGGPAPVEAFREPPTIEPSSDNEQAAVGNIGIAYATYLEMTALGNEQNGTDTYVYDAGEWGTSPRLVGYEISVSREVGPGQYETVPGGLLVADGRVTNASNWDQAGPLAAEDFAEGRFTIEVPSLFEQPLTPESPGEQAAVAAVEEWLEQEFPEAGLDRVSLTGYAFLWGKSTDEAYLMLSIPPDGLRYMGSGLNPSE